MYHILAAQCQGQYGPCDRQNQPPEIAPLGVAADAPCLIELARAVRARVGGVEEQMQLARSGGSLDPFAADHDIARARLESQAVEGGLSQRLGDSIGQIGGDGERVGLERPRERAAQPPFGDRFFELCLGDADPRPASR